MRKRKNKKCRFDGAWKRKGIKKSLVLPLTQQIANHATEARTFHRLSLKKMQDIEEQIEIIAQGIALLLENKKRT